MTSLAAIHACICRRMLRREPAVEQGPAVLRVAAHGGGRHAFVWLSAPRPARHDRSRRTRQQRQGQRREQQAREQGGGDEGGRSAHADDPSSTPIMLKASGVVSDVAENRPAAATWRQWWSSSPANSTDGKPRITSWDARKMGASTSVDALVSSAWRSNLRPLVTKNTGIRNANPSASSLLDVCG